jgi:L-asparaginase
MADADREAVRTAVANTPESMIVLTHGTDTMIETAKKLLDIPDKTIVLTGAIEPAKFKISDAPFNIGCAIMAVQTLPPGAYLVLNGEIFDPRYTRKNAGISRFERTR